MVFLNGNKDDKYITKVAHDVVEACELLEVGFEYVTSEYNDGGKIFRKLDLNTQRII